MGFQQGLVYVEEFWSKKNLEKASRVASRYVKNVLKRSHTFCLIFHSPMAAPCRLIITADDFGYSEGRNRGIVQAFEKGIVQRTSLMVNGVQAEDAVRRAKSCGLPMGEYFVIFLL